MEMQARRNVDQYMPSPKLTHANQEKCFQKIKTVASKMNFIFFLAQQMNSNTCSYKFPENIPELKIKYIILKHFSWR
jgi:hypothetical protein